MLTLNAAVDRLAAHYGALPRLAITDPFELILLQNVAYLASDDRRLEAFALLKNSIGTRPEQLLAASAESLDTVTSRGILKGISTQKLRECARIARDEFGGDLSHVIKGPVDQARRALQRFPGIGQPGAEKILLFAAGQPFLAPESNGLRVLVRLGFVEQDASYARMYARAHDAAQSLGTDATSLQTAHRLLRRHGQVICKNRQPLCPSCPLCADCPYAQTHAE